MRTLNLVAALLLAVPVSTFVVGCSDSRDTDRREALEAEALQRELDLALQPDTTVQPELSDVPEEAPAATPAPRAQAETPRPEPEPTPPPRPRERAPERAPAPRPEESAPEPERTPEPAPAPSAPAVASLSAPAGTGFSVSIDRDLSTRTSPTGTTFTATLSEPLVSADGRTVIPAGATVNGRVVESRHSSRAGQEAVLRVAFTSVSYGGRSYPIDATVGAVPSKLVTRDSNAEKAAKVGGGVALGAILGHVLGHGAGATVAGAVAGAAAGTAVAIGTATVDRVIPAGSRVDLRLDAPVEVKG